MISVFNSRFVHTFKYCLILILYMQKECRFCHKMIRYQNWRKYACHCASCKSNPMVLKKYRKGILTRKKLYDMAISRALYCKKCGKKYKLNLTEYKYLKGDYRKNCSRKCSNSKLHSNKTKQKISNKLKRRTITTCKFCNHKFESIVGRNRQFCSNKCRGKYRTQEKIKLLDDFKKYRELSKFKFNVYSFPEQFNIALIKEHGWYHPVKNNNGISRDHIIPIYYGYKNNIDHKIISHPVNCQLLRMKHNLSKGTKLLCSVSDIKKEIKKWNKIHGEPL